VDAHDVRGVGRAQFEVMQGEIVDPQGLTRGLCRGRHPGPPFRCPEFHLVKAQRRP